VAGRRVLITGVSTHLGTALARRLEADPEVEYVAGLDSRPPQTPLERTEFIEADIRQPEVMRLLAPTRVDTLVHNNILRQPRSGMSPQAAHDTNVIGSLQLMAACESVKTLRTLVVRGSAGIYGSEPSAPQFFTEDMTRLYPARTRFQRDVAEIENYFATFARRNPRIRCTMLRYQPAIGPSLETQITRYIGLGVLPTFMGYDPRLQFVHEIDAVEALVAAVRNPVSGPVNVAGRGTIGLARMVRLTGKLSLPIAPPLFEPTVALGRRFGLGARFSPDFQRLLRYGRGVDTRRLTEEIGFKPRYSTAAAVEDFLSTLGSPPPAAPVRQVVRR